ncbi:MAG: extracellular solute-binding protein, partial [Pseudomonadota bacterium]
MGTKKLLGWTTALGLGLAAMAAHAQDKKELHYSGWINLYPHHAAAVGAIEGGFEEKHPDVDWVLNDVPFDQALKQATVAALAGNAPDNIHLIAGWIPALHDIGALEPLNDYFTEEEWSRIPEASLESVTFDGQIMAMPWVPGPIIMFYNRNLMEQA